MGRFSLEWHEQQFRVRDVLDNNRVVVESSHQHPFVAATWGSLEAQESRGVLSLREVSAGSSSSMRVEQWSAGDDRLRVVFRGAGARPVTFLLDCSVVTQNQLRLLVRVSPDGHDHPVRLSLRLEADAKEGVFGFGEQFTHWNVKGRSLFVLSQEPGIGRGVQPLTWMMERFFGAGGQWYSSNAPVPFFVTTGRRAIALANKELSHFSFCDPTCTEVSVYANELDLRIFAGESPAELTEAFTQLSGRMRPLPDWIDKGAVIGLQGGRERVEAALSRLAAHGVPVAAVWIQDWVGCRRTSIGKQLWWNWEPDDEAYPNWPAFVQGLRQRGIEVLGYVNPFLVDARTKGGFRRNLYAEAEALGYLVRRQDGSVYPIQNTSFSAGLVDIANPAAFDWLKEIIKAQLLGSGMRGYMADFGEALPFDACIYNGRSASSYHNHYPEEWARLNREAIEEAGLGDEAVFFCRAGFTESPRFATLFWLGDQLTSWHKEDGIKSVVVGLLSSGLCGFAYNHGDIGGYTATTVPGVPVRIPGLFFARERELLWRWIELCAFTAVFRTHEGNQPEVHRQIFDDDDSLAHFARFARTYAGLGAYRRRLGVAAAERGTPLVRALWFAFPDDPDTLSVDDQFLLGDDVLVAPVMEPRISRRRLYLPEGEWVHLWTGQRHTGGGASGWTTIDAPLGQPPVFLRVGSAVLDELTRTLTSHGDLPSGLYRACSSREEAHHVS
ncbi:MAG: alpha-glucosidase [Myxococcota bacterium]